VRKLVLLLAIGLVLPFYVPHDASATTVWKVRNKAGKVVGTVRKAPKKAFRVRDRKGVPHGGLAPSPNGWSVVMALPEDTGARKVATISIGTKYVPWYTLVSDVFDPTDSRIGRVVKRKKRWVVQWDVSNDFSRWRTRGSVSGSCKPWAALGAVWILDDKWQ
jgi:hypothetical protein